MWAQLRWEETIRWRIQSMTTTSTNDTEGSVEQAIRIIEAGGEYVRLTTQGVREAGKPEEHQTQD